MSASSFLISGPSIEEIDAKVESLNQISGASKNTGRSGGAYSRARRFELFLARSRSALLYLRGSGGISEESVLAALNHLDRWKEITLQLEGRDADSWVRRITLEPTPQLKVLSLEDTTPSPADLFQFAADGDAFPVLQPLSLSGYTFKASTAGSLTNLRTLTISSRRGAYHGVQRSTAQHTDPAEFFSLLNGLPLLSSLTLANALAPHTQLAPPISVSLPNLTHLSIEDAHAHPMPG